MKKLLLITVLLVAITAKLAAQEKQNIEIKKIENNQFKITAKEEMNINLRFNLEPEDVYNVFVCDKQMHEVTSRKYYKKGAYKIAFTMEEGEQYTVKFISKSPIKLIAATFAEN